MLASIREQGALTEELAAQLAAAETMVVVEDLYRPYKPKRRTRATISEGKGPRAACRYNFAAGDKNAACRGGGKIY